MNTVEEQRSGIAIENLDEVLAAEQNPGWTAWAGQNQYFTPPAWAGAWAGKLKQLARLNAPATVIDPQAGTFNLLKAWPSWTDRYAVELDQRITAELSIRLITANCMRFFEVLDDLHPGMVWQVGCANPPFGKRWIGPDGKVIDSTLATWNFLVRHTECGYLVSNANTLEKLGIRSDPRVLHFEEFEKVWDDVDVKVGVVWYKTGIACTGVSWRDWSRMNDILIEEKGKVPEFNVWLDAKGTLKTYLSSRFQLKRKLTGDDITRLGQLSGYHPLALTHDRRSRDLLTELVSTGVYKIAPEAKAAIQEALRQVCCMASPIMPPTEFELVAYADEQDQLTCVHPNQLGFTVGNKYQITTETYEFTDKYCRPKIVETEEGTTVEDHEFRLTGQDRLIRLINDQGLRMDFMDRPNPLDKFQHPESDLWSIFERPVVQTVAEADPKKMAHNLKALTGLEAMAKFKFYGGVGGIGQKDYLARVLTKDCALIAGETGCGKSLFATMLVACKCPKRALIIAPQGTVKSNDDDDDEDATQYQAAQWLQELKRFTPFLRVFQLFSMEDYHRIANANGGVLPRGVYISYYQAMFSNGGARETCPDKWTDDTLRDLIKEDDLVLPKHNDDPKRGWCSTIGKENAQGIRCILKPCMSTLIGDQFDMVILDECHIVRHLTSNVTQMIIRMQPKYRFGQSATPIPNIVSNLFAIMGWINVPNWYLGEQRNVAWPYARGDFGRFCNTYLTKERDVTQEQINREKDPTWKGNCMTVSPVISSPARLLKILKPSLAFISKEQCRADMPKCNVIDIRVPFGQQQGSLYAYFLNRSNIPCGNALARARKQLAYLRWICADPVSFEHGGPAVTSIYNPKLMAVLELVRQIVARGEQFILVSARKVQTTTMINRLTDAGLRMARIDSTVPAFQHSAQARLFKRGKVHGMGMGIMCAQAHSFTGCPNLIICSLDYTYGSKHQAEGRIFRVDSPKDCNVFCVLHENSIEEIMFDKVATKGDSATICLRGQRVPRDYHPVSFDEVLADSMVKFSNIGLPNELDLMRSWPALRDLIRKAA